MEATLLTLGVILILVGLIGQVKAKEIEVGTQNPIVRVILGLIGFIFVSIALYPIIPLFQPASTNTPTLTTMSPATVLETASLSSLPTTIAPPSDTPISPTATIIEPPTNTPVPPPPTATSVPPPSLTEDCLPFDTNSVRLQESGGNWSIVDGGAMLYFGPNEAEARESLNIISYYRMDDQCFVGRPDPSLEYWLVNNESPSGSYSGEDCIGFNLSNIEVANIDGRWKIVDGNNWLLDFADIEEEARKSYEILQHYGFNNICFVGRPDPSMIYFRR